MLKINIIFLLLFISLYVFPEQHLTEAFVTRVIDGDTIVLSNGERVRFIGVDAPEVGQPGADLATHFVRELIDRKIVWLEVDGPDRDRYGRLRRYIWIQEPINVDDPAEIRSFQLNALLLEYGLASVMIIGKVKNEALFRSITQSSVYIPRTPLPAKEGNFIGNRASFVFHTLSCSSLPMVHNRIYFQMREEALQLDYRLCSRCRP
jgi:micrococcal nuclease